MCVDVNGGAIIGVTENFLQNFRLDACLDGHGGIDCIPHPPVADFHNGPFRFVSCGEITEMRLHTLMNWFKRLNGTIVYNIGKMQEKSIPQIGGSSNLANGALRGNASASSISTSSGNVKAKFSMKESVEETKDLIAVHNVSEEGLQGALELGGLPSPSIAITKDDMGHEKYGPISLVFGKETMGTVMECYVNSRNPYVVNDPGNYDSGKLQEQGYDGIWHRSAVTTSRWITEV